jgi:hypothetical protein
VPLYNAAGLLADLRVLLGDYWWVGFMLFSSLLPTLAHLAIGAFALFTLASGWLGRPIAAGLMKGDSPEGRAASLALTLAAAAAAVWLRAAPAASRGSPPASPTRACARC